MNINQKIVTSEEVIEAMNEPVNKSVIHTIKNNWKRTLSKHDIKSAILVGTWRSLKKFDKNIPSKTNPKEKNNCKFSTLLYKTITWELLDALNYQKRQLKAYESDFEPKTIYKDFNISLYTDGLDKEELEILEILMNDDVNVKEISILLNKKRHEIDKIISRIRKKMVD